MVKGVTRHAVFTVWDTTSSATTLMVIVSSAVILTTRALYVLGVSRTSMLVCLVGWLVGFLTSSTATALYRADKFQD